MCTSKLSTFALHPTKRRRMSLSVLLYSPLFLSPSWSRYIVRLRHALQPNVARDRYLTAAGRSATPPLTCRLQYNVQEMSWTGKYTYTCTKGFATYGVSLQPGRQHSNDTAYLHMSTRLSKQSITRLTALSGLISYRTRQRHGPQLQLLRTAGTSESRRATPFFRLCYVTISDGTRVTPWLPLW
jgi:hypothetical protein